MFYTGMGSVALPGEFVRLRDIVLDDRHSALGVFTHGGNEPAAGL